MSVVLVDYGAGNLRSVSAALARAGAEPVVTTDPNAVREASLAVIAGVGNVESAALGLVARRRRPSRPRASAGRSSASASGCSCSSGRVRREEADSACYRAPCASRAGRRVPHMGWNTLALLRPFDAPRRRLTARTSTSRTATPSNRTTRSPSRASTMRRAGSSPRSSRIARGVQFHPERSAEAGARVLENALRWSRSA